MKDKTLFIGGSILTLIVNIFLIIFIIKLFRINLFCAIIAIIFCIAIGYFDGIIFKYFINKYKEIKNK